AKVSAEVAAVIVLTEVVIVVVSMTRGVVLTGCGRSAAVGNPVSATRASIVASAGAAPDVINTGLPSEIAAARGSAAPGRRTPASAGAAGGLALPAAGAGPHHGAVAVGQQRAADPPGGSRRSRAKERAARGSRLRAQRGCRLGFGAVFGRYAHGGTCRPYRRDGARALRVAASPHAVAHRVEEAALLWRLSAAELIFE